MNFEKLNDEIKRIIFDEGHCTEVDHTFTVKPKPSTLGSIIKISRQEPLFSVLSDDTIRNFLGFNTSILYEEYNLSPNLGDILHIDNIFLECNIA